MPFKSEKQRRFLWAAHPDIAKRWAHEYPESNKGLPMYAKKKKTQKEAALTAISRYVNNLNNLKTNVSTGQNPPVLKKANSKQEYIEIPHSEKPTYAGEEQETTQANNGHESSCDTDTKLPKNRQQSSINELLKKVALVAAPKFRQLKENNDAAAEGREPVPVTQNQNVKRYPVATPGIMPPIGMQQQQAQQQPQQPQSRPSAPPVGNGSTPQSRPIQSFGGLDVNNKLTGNSGLAGGRNPGKALKQSSALPMNNNLAQSQQNSQPGFNPLHSIGGAINTLDQGTGLGWGTLGGITTAPVGVAGMGYLRALRPYWENTQNTPEWQQMMDYVEKNHPELNVRSTQQIRREGRTAVQGLRNDLFQSDAAATRGRLKNWLMNFGLNSQKKQVEMIGKQPGFYHPGNAMMQPTIAYNTRYKTPGILAHELGHHLGGKTMARAQVLGRVGSGLGTLGALTATNEDTSRNRAFAGSAAFLPTMISEIDASRRGAKIMKNLKLPGRWKAFAGLPSYAMAAGAPMMAHYGKKLLGGFKSPGQEKQSGSPAWQRSEGKNDAGGLNAKGRASYNNATGGNLKAPVTESNPKGDRAKRQNSFCSRMCGMKKHETGSKTKKDPDSRINKSLRKWNCKCGSVEGVLELVKNFSAAKTQ